MKLKVSGERAFKRIKRISILKFSLRRLNLIALLAVVLVRKIAVVRILRVCDVVLSFKGEYADLSEKELIPGETRVTSEFLGASHVSAIYVIVGVISANSILEAADMEK